MKGSNDVPRLKFRAISLVIWASGLRQWTIVFVALFLICSTLVALFEPAVGGFPNAMWLMFQVVTTIGLGDYTATSFLGRIAAVALSVYSVFYIALITGAVVNFCSERMHARRNESVARFLDRLEHLPELSKEELAELSSEIKKNRSRYGMQSKPAASLAKPSE